MDAGKLTITN